MAPPSRENRPAPREPTPHTAATSPPLLAERASQPLLAVVAHELRTSLSALVAGSELLVDQLATLDPDQLRDLVSVIHRGTLWMQELVENLLCAASINTGRFQLHRGWVEPLAIVAEVQPVVVPLLTQ